jgi:hypothetical protein
LAWLGIHTSFIPVRVLLLTICCSTVSLLLTSVFSHLSDNGKEFIAKAVVALLMENNPHIFILTGRPRTPRDQGSVENANKLVQRVLKGISIDQKRKGETVNWTTLLGQIMSVVNSQTGVRKYSASSYQAVFGQRYFPTLRCSVDELRKCTSIHHQRLKMSPDERLETYVREKKIVDLEPNVVKGSEDEDDEDVDDTNESEGND